MTKTTKPCGSYAKMQIHSWVSKNTFSEKVGDFIVRAVDIFHGRRHRRRIPFNSRLEVYSLSLCLDRNEVTLLWKEMTIWWKEVTQGWNEVVMGRSNRILTIHMSLEVSVCSGKDFVIVGRSSLKK